MRRTLEERTADVEKLEHITRSVGLGCIVLVIVALALFV